VPLPETFDDEPNAGVAADQATFWNDQAAYALTAIHQGVLVPRLLGHDSERLGWDPMLWPTSLMPGAPDVVKGSPAILGSVDATMWSTLALMPRVIPPADPAAAHELVAMQLRSEYPGIVNAAVVGSVVVGLAVFGGYEPRDNARDLLAIGVAPGYRRQGIATRLLRAYEGSGVLASFTVAERDVLDPLPRDERATIARRLLVGTGFELTAADPEALAIDPHIVSGERR
jgi:GNAT superfamily N-acetyltransferase